MKYFVQIVDNEIYRKEEFEELPDFAENVEFVEVEKELWDTLEEGMLYDREDNTFSEAELPKKVEFTKLEFAQLLTTEERIAIRQSVDPIVEDFRELLSFAETINTTHDTTQQGLLYLFSQGIVSEATKNKILGD